MMVRLTRAQGARGIPEWLRFVHTCNGVDKIFDAPVEQGDWWAGGSFELYGDARIVFGATPDEGVRIVAVTDHGAEVMREAAKQLGIHHTEENA